MLFSFLSVTVNEKQCRFQNRVIRAMTVSGVYYIQEQQTLSSNLRGFFPLRLKCVRIPFIYPARLAQTSSSLRCSDLLFPQYCTLISEYTQICDPHAQGKHTKTKCQMQQNNIKSMTAYHTLHYFYQINDEEKTLQP